MKEVLLSMATEQISSIPISSIPYRETAWEWMERMKHSCPALSFSCIPGMHGNGWEWMGMDGNDWTQQCHINPLISTWYERLTSTPKSQIDSTQLKEN